MPNGFVNAMAIWSRFLDTVLEPWQFKCVLCYADDCLVFTKSDSIDDHLRDLDRVFDLFEKFGVKVKSSKLKLCLKAMPFLGVLVTENGIMPDPQKTKAITSLPEPETVGALRRILGIFAYYRKFIPKFSDIAAPLYSNLGKKVSTNSKDEGCCFDTRGTGGFCFTQADYYDHSDCAFLSAMGCTL